MPHRPVIALIAVAAAVVTPPATASTPGDPPLIREAADDATTLALRQETVRRAQRLLAARVRYQATAEGPIRRSGPEGARNHLEHNGSNANRNEFNRYSGEDWCGYFVARAWTGKNSPRASAYPRLPALYMRAQAWRTDADGRYRTFRRDRMPRKGDALVWQNGPGRPGQVTGERTGHVGVVIAVNRDTRRVTTIEGNVNGDEIARRSYAWDADGPSLPGKHFLGHTRRR